MAAISSASATTIVDPVGDFLPTFTGSQNGDVDIRSTTVTFDGTNFDLSATVNGTLGTTEGSLFVWGVNRGSGTARLTFGSPSLGSNVLFDAVVVMFPDGLLRVVTFVGAIPTITPFPAGVTVAGDTLSASVPVALLFSTGYTPDQYTFALWSRDRANPLADGGNNEIADFAPNSGTFRAVPEPSTWLMMLLGFGLAGGAMRFRSRRAVMAGAAAS